MAECACAGTEWVCENHPDSPWGEDGCDCGPGVPCPQCNPLHKDAENAG